MKQEDGCMSLAHLKAVSAPRAWTWKVVAPTSSATELTDTQYRISARLNLNLRPLEGAAALPATCPLCESPGSINADPWHFLSCYKLSKGEVNVRHDEVGRALYRSALMMGIRARLEYKGLDPASDLRPDLLISLPGRNVLADVAVCHPLAPGTRVKKGSCTLGRAKHVEAAKRRKYLDMSVQHHFEQLPFVVETCGGVGPSGDRLMKAMAEASEDHLCMWSRVDVIRELVGSVAIAVQRGGALTYLEGYDRSLHAVHPSRRKRAAASKKGAGGQKKDEDEDGAEWAESEEEDGADGAAAA
jgi:hypothetical protein